MRMASCVSGIELSAESGLPMPDSIILAAALRHDAVLWTQDADFRGMDGVEYRACAD